MAAESKIREGDYVSPNLKVVSLDCAFPNMIVGDRKSNCWPYLRREISHNWYVDRRNPTVGFLSRDEAVLLHNIALLHAGKPCLEIGCWRGWSTAHIALGAGNLEVIDPVLTDADFREDVAASLHRAEVLDRVMLHGAASPDAIGDLSEETGKRWSLIFIDGDHEREAPRLDAEAVHRYAAADATIVLHDLASPHVAAALMWLRDHGWQIAIYQTMQIMGVAVRGSDQILLHQPDPSQRWTVPDHLMGVRVVGEPRGEWIARLLAWLEGDVATHAPADVSALDHLPKKEAAAVDHLLERLAARQAAPAGLAEAFDLLQARHMALVDRLVAIEANLPGPSQFDRLQLKHVQALKQLGDAEFREAELQQALAAAAGEVENARAAAAERDMALGLFDRLQLKHVQALKQLGDVELREAELQQALAATAGEVENTRAAAALVPRPVQQSQHTAINEAASLLARKRILFGLTRRVLAGRTAEVRRLVEDILRRAGLPESTIARAVWLGSPRVVLGLARRRLLGGMQAVQGLIVLQLEHAARPDLWGEMTGSEAERMRDLEERLAATERRFAALEAAKLQDERALLEADLALAQLRAQLTSGEA